MTENEAIGQLKYMYKTCMDEKCKHKGQCDLCCESRDMAIQALEEIQQCREYKEIFESHFSEEALKLLSNKEEFGKWLERGRWIAKKCDEINRELEQYRAIGTIEEIKALKEKSVPRKIKGIRFKEAICPNCETELFETYWAFGGIHYCSNCGQKLDWQ